MLAEPSHRDVLRFYLRLFADVPRVLWHGFSRVFTCLTILGVLLLVVSRPLGLAVLNWDLSAWWALAPVGILALYGLMKANYQKFAMTEQKRNENTAAAEELFQALKALQVLYENSKPARIFYENLRRQEEEDEQIWPAQQLEREARNLINDIRELAGRRPSGQLQPQRSITLVEALAARKKVTGTPEEIVTEYGRDLAATVLAIKSRFDALGLTSDLLASYCTQEPRTVETIKRIAEALEALVIRLQPMTQRKTSE